TEAEWEYACRAGTNTPYNYGQNPSNLTDYGWYRENTEQIQVVGGKQCNQWGLFDMYGNVSEWCQDVYAAEYYGNVTTEKDPTGPTTGTRRVLRGGNFMSQASSCRSSYRGQAPADIESQLNGLRVVCIKR
ncbi:MAG: formylglycine-generating enzyme family protein, partial [Planctomycetaceae bacterium]|nr:formylglycine-generating enzyme family protein [Planctomycetaceae bacterium]